MRFYVLRMLSEWVFRIVTSEWIIFRNNCFLYKKLKSTTKTFQLDYFPQRQFSFLNHIIHWYYNTNYIFFLLYFEQIDIYKTFPGNIKLPDLEEEILAYWKDNNVFKKSVSFQTYCKTFTFYGVPPTTNGLSGIHHVISRAVWKYELKKEI